MRKIILSLVVLLGTTVSAFAAETTGLDHASQLTLSALLVTALLTAVIHTITGPDHYLPFIAIAKSRDYSLKKTLFWTFVCGLAIVFGL